MRRIFVLLTVAAVMALALLVSAMPAFAVDVANSHYSPKFAGTEFYEVGSLDVLGSTRSWLPRRG